MQDKEKMLLIEESFVNLLIQYLSARPFGEVYQAVAKLQSLQSAPSDEGKI